MLSENILNRRIMDFNLTAAIKEFNKIQTAELNTSQSEKKLKIDEGMLWHIRLGHPSLNYLKELNQSNEMLEKVKFEENILQFETCILAKIEKLPFKENRRKANRLLHTIHVDIMGKFNTTSFPGDYSYMIVFIDDYLRCAKIYSIKNKNEASNKLKEHRRSMIFCCTSILSFCTLMIFLNSIVFWFS